MSAGWLGYHEAPQTPLHLLNPPKAPAHPDYPGLVEVLQALCPIPDALGEFIPTSKQAADLRRCGFKARAGRPFLIPRLPGDLVWCTVLSHLSDRVDPFFYPPDWKPIRAAVVPLVGPIDPLSKREKQILGLLRNGSDNRRTRTHLLQSVSGWACADLLDRMLDRLTALNRITKDDEGWIYPYGRVELESIRRREQERRLTPIYSIYPDGSRIYHRNP